MFRTFTRPTIVLTLMTSMILGQSARAEEEFSQEQRDEAAKLIGHLWLSFRPHLTKEEMQVLSELMNKGLKRHHQALKDKEQHAKGEK